MPLQPRPHQSSKNLENPDKKLHEFDEYLSK